jgi:flavin-dependent dehydrogenase
MRDLVVIGGGPLGLVTSLYAAGSGLAVTVLEPRLAGEGPEAPGPIDKACGEGLMPGALSGLQALGVEPVGLPFKGIRYTDGRRSVDAAFRCGPGRGVRRTALHEALLEAVCAAGIEVLALASEGITQDDASVAVCTVRPRGVRGPVLGAAHVIAAVGLHSPTRRPLHPAARASRGATRRHGLRQHSAIPPWSDFVEVHWSPAGEAYVTPVSPDAVGVAILTERREPFAALVRSFPALAARLRDAPAASPVMGAGPFRQKAARRVAGRVLLVGDASGYVDALTGEGLAVGIAEAREAVRAVAAGRPEGYERAWRRVTWRSAALTHLLVRATRPAFGRRVIVPVAERAPVVFDWAVNALARPL